MNVKSIYEQAIGARFEQLHPLLKKKYGKQLGALTATGTMNHIRGSVVYRLLPEYLQGMIFYFLKEERTYHSRLQIRITRRRKLSIGIVPFIFKKMCERFLHECIGMRRVSKFLIDLVGQEGLCNH
ncbi:hypothetical protein JCM19039_2643 [Geomicrobium sp. JCM 19039]|nr:hypothetical protein JCM19039_2643 [Geomicrobium sp. JCM 19039]